MNTYDELLDLLHDGSPYENFPPYLLNYDLQGWGSEDQIFGKLIEVVKPKLIVEVGSWKGASAITMGKHVKRLGLSTCIVCVDTWLGSMEHLIYKKWRKSLRKRYGYPQLYYTFLSNVIEHELTDVIIPFPATSSTAFDVFLKKDVVPDLVYIDGEHGYNAVLQDLRMYWSLLSDHGVLFGDDYLKWSDVTQAVQNFAEEIGKTVIGKREKFVFVRDPLLHLGFVPIAAGSRASKELMVL